MTDICVVPVIMAVIANMIIGVLMDAVIDMGFQNFDEHCDWQVTVLLDTIVLVCLTFDARCHKREHRV